MNGLSKVDLRGVTAVVALGCAWGLVESCAGVSLRGSCAKLFTGSLLTGACIFFFAAAAGYGSRMFMLLLLPLLASALRIYTGILLGQKVMSGAVANPVFAFWMECVSFMLVYAFAHRWISRSLPGGIAMGAVTAALSAVMFLPVKMFTGISACVVPGGSTPLAIWGMPIAIVVGAIMMPLGFRAGQSLLKASSKASPRWQWLPVGCEVAVSILCVIALTVVYV